jgi:hypothetical protein
MVHLMTPEMEIATQSGYRRMQGAVPKCRAMLVSDKHGNPVDPVSATQNSPFSYFINTRFRQISGGLPGIGGQ